MARPEALAALTDLKVEVPVVGLAKEKPEFVRAGEETKPVDRVYVPGAKNAIAVHTSPALQLLAYARDEAHRVSNAYRLKLGERRTLRSELDDIKGIGPKTRAKLLAALGSMKGVREATLEELTGAGATERQANAILTALGSKPPPAANISAAERDAVDHAFDAASEAEGVDE